MLESTMDNFLLRSVLEMSKTQIAFSNGWRYGVPIPPDSTITLNDLYDIIPMNPLISRCEITGEELWKMMEENLERTFSPDPYMQMGGYLKRCVGLNIYFKVENPAGKRIQEFFVDGKPVDRYKKYDTSFITQQAIPEKYGTNRHDLDILVIDAMKEYLSKHSPVDIGFEGTFVVV